MGVGGGWRGGVQNFEGNWRASRCMHLEVQKVRAHMEDQQVRAPGGLAGARTWSKPTWICAYFHIFGEGNSVEDFNARQCLQ